MENFHTFIQCILTISIHHYLPPTPPALPTPTSGLHPTSTTSPLVLVIVAMIDNPCIQLLLPICVWMRGQPLGLGQPIGSYITRERPSLINHTVNNSSAKGVVLGAPFPVPKLQKEHFVMRKAIDTFTNVFISIF